MAIFGLKMTDLIKMSINPLSPKVSFLYDPLKKLQPYLITFGILSSIDFKHEVEI